jgi:hypothetical protein
VVLTEEKPSTRSVPEVAQELGITERAVRKRIQAGSLQGELVNGRWYVVLPSPDATPVPRCSPGASVKSSASGTRPATPASRRPEPEPPEDGSESVPATHAAELLKMLRELQQQNLELAGQVGFLQAKLSTTQEQLLLAEHSGEPDQEPEPERAEARTNRPKRSLLDRLFRG